MSSYTIKPSPGETAWFRHDRFGMFLHFGLYAMPARHEQVKSRECMTEEAYDLYFKHFDPDLFDAREWARQARAAGMKYAVLTTKHHDGFCLFDSRYTDYKITNTPFGRDLVKEYVEAFRAEGLRVGFYYSLLDWHHPHFPIDVRHPRRLDPDAEAQDAGRDMCLYAQYMRDQVTELLTNYGKIDILWFDFDYPTPAPCFMKDYRPFMRWGGGKGKAQWESAALLALARSLQPHLIIDNRAGIEQDIWTPEQIQPTEWVRHPTTGEYVTWETCQTFSGSWGYHRDEASWKSPKMLINMLINTVSRGGNLLMNVGPTARGCFDARATAALAAYADWMRYHSRAIYGCTMAEPEWHEPEGTRMTQSEDGKRLYIHLMDYPFATLCVEGLADQIEYAQFLHDGSELTYSQNTTSFAAEEDRPHVAGAVFLNLPPVKPDVLVPVIEVFLK